MMYKCKHKLQYQLQQAGVFSLLVAGMGVQAAPPETDFYSLSLAELGQVQIAIATGNNTSLEHAPASASVISAAEIESMGARTLDEVIGSLAGFHVTPSALSRMDILYSVRGIHTGFNSQVLLLMNGVPVQFSLQGGRPTLFRFPVSSIDRIEVIRGPGSAVYGADAYAAVINVITKTASALEKTTVGARAGSFGGRDVWLQGASEWQGWDIALNMAYSESSGDKGRRINRDLQTSLDELFGTQASHAPGALSTRYQLLDTHISVTGQQLRINLWNWQSQDAGLGAGGSQVLDPDGSNDGDLWMADATYDFDPESSQWQNSLRLSHMTFAETVNYHLLPAGSLAPIGADGNLSLTPDAELVYFADGLIGQPGGRAQDSQMDFISLFTGWQAHRLRLAVGMREQRLTTSERKNFGPGVSNPGGPLVDVSDTAFVYLPDSQRRIGYLSLQDEWQLSPELQFTLGARYDDYSDVGSRVNPRMALVWSNNEKLTSKLLYGSAFRAPSFAELRFQNNPVTLGNSQLKPELIDTLELSFNYLLNTQWQTTVTLFSYQARDMIEFVTRPDETLVGKQANNVLDVDGDGFEWEVLWKPSSQLHMSGSYSTQRAQDVRTHHRVADAPGEQIKIMLDWEFAPEWFLNQQLQWVSDRVRALGDARPAIADYTLVGLSLRRHNLWRNVDVSLAARNLFDEDARAPSSGEIAEDYPLEGRSLWLQVNYQFD